MKINIQPNNVILTSRQKSVIEKKLRRLKKYLKEEPAIINLILQDETGSEKGGIDQSIHLSVLVGKEKIFIKEVDENLMKAFNCALNRFERRLSQFHDKSIERSQGNGENRLEKIWGFIRRTKKGKKPEEDVEE